MASACTATINNENDKMKNDIFRFERELVLNSVLKIIHEDQARTMPVIAWYAGLTEHTVKNVFPSTDSIMQQLVARIAGSIATRVHAVERNPGASFPELFKQLWESMLTYYIQHPEVISFVEQSKRLGTAENELTIAIQEFFTRHRHSLTGKIDVSLLALLFNGSVMTAAKALGKEGTQDKTNTEMLVGMLWEGLKGQGLVR